MTKTEIDLELADRGMRSTESGEAGWMVLLSDTTTIHATDDRAVARGLTPHPEGPGLPSEIWLVTSKWCAAQPQRILVTGREFWSTERHPSELACCAHVKYRPMGMTANSSIVSIYYDGAHEIHDVDGRLWKLPRTHHPGSLTPVNDETHPEKPE
jgi:hypothetical protein